MNTTTRPRAELEQQRLARQAQQPQIRSTTRLTPLRIYLLGYNIISALLWANLLFITLSFIFTSRPGQSTPFWNRLLASSPAARKWLGVLPSPISRLAGSYGYRNLGRLTRWTQSLAVLEVVHAALGWVRSPMFTTASQVASRVYTVWGVVEAVPKTQSNPLFTTMLLAWSLTEVVRYTYYATSLLGIKTRTLDWLRYTTFIPLYPLGAGSEAFLSFSTLPSFSSFPLPDRIKALIPVRQFITNLPAPLRTAIIRTGWGRALLWNWAKAGAKTKVGLGREWQVADLGRLVLFLIWWPALYSLYTYMLKQRRKVLGGGKLVGRVNKAL